jgi:hypothetical protein
MNIIEQLNKLGFLCRSTIFVGFNLGFLSKKDIEYYVIDLLLKSNNNDDLSLLADTSLIDDEEIKEIILSQYSQDKIVVLSELEKLQLAMLLSIKESEMSDDEKCNALQSVYMEFNYPDNMSACSIYSGSNMSPLNALDNVILSLKNKYFHLNKDNKK